MDFTELQNNSGSRDLGTRRAPCSSNVS